MGIVSRTVVALFGGLIALLPHADAATCKGGKRADSAVRCKATPAKKAAKKASPKGKANAGTNSKAAAGAPERGPLYVFIESGGCRVLATESSVRRMQEIAVGGSVTWDGRCVGGLISGVGVLRQEGVFIEGGRSRHFAYYYSGKAKNGARTGQWTRETMERFEGSPRSWTSLARVDFVDGVARGAPKPVPVRGQDQHGKSFTTRVLEPEAKRAKAFEQATPPGADSGALSHRAEPAVATVAPTVAPPVAQAQPPSIAAVESKPAAQPIPQAPATVTTASPMAAPAAPKTSVAALAPVPAVPRPAAAPAVDALPRVTATFPTAPAAVSPAPTFSPAAAVAPQPDRTPQEPVLRTSPITPKPTAVETFAAPPTSIPETVKATTVKPAPPSVAATPAPAPPMAAKAPPAVAPVAARATFQTAPTQPAPVAAALPQAAVKAIPALPETMERQAFGFGTGCYMDTLDGQLWENSVPTIKDRKSLRIDGWAVDDEERVLAEATYLRLEGANGRRYYATTTVQDRPDVAKHFGVAEFARAGYRAVVSAEGLPPGEYEVTIVMNSKGRNVLCGNGRRLKL